MDTKSINRWQALVAGILLCCLVCFSVLAAVDLVKNRENFSKDAYFRSLPFYEQMQMSFNLVRYVHIDNKGYPAMTPEEKVSSRLEAWKRAIAPQKLTEEQTAEYLKKQSADYIAYRDSEYANVKRSLEARKGIFAYYIVDSRANDVYTNLPQTPNDRYLEEEAFYSLRFPQPYLQNGWFQQINQYFQNNQLAGYLIVPKAADGYSQVYNDYAYYQSIRDRLIKEAVLLGLSLAAAAGLVFYFVRTGAWRPLQEGAAGSVIRRIPLDLRWAAALLAVLIVLTVGSSTVFFRLPPRVSQVAGFVLLALLTAYAVLCLLDAAQFIRRPDRLREEWQRSLLVRIRTLFQRNLGSRSIAFKAGLVFFLTGGLGIAALCGLLGLSDRYRELLLVGVLYTLFYGVTVLPYLIRRFRLLTEIKQGASEAASGNLDFTIRETGRGNLRELASHMNNMKQGFKLSLESQMKSERLKSELITNVSHDLKTPLTSIINYVDLLKQKELTPEQIHSYVDVLDRKTQRLKTLIEDLFDASKMASGNVELKIETVNVADLLNQALAEFNDRIAESSLTFRVHVANPSVTAPLDGKQTWRVFENLIGNALNYSLPHSRVYIDLFEEPGRVVLTIKNVSAYEIDFAAEELFERFKRGDQSRHTDGSGLGLAIAKSIVEMQGGRLEIELNGDLFQVTVTFAKSAPA
ncbi:two-component sensor histidine kinase [Paenibacillus sp. J31TS4]|uniref:sensor histidine kinase n=1 Tax=Paenibacillus sp. J31TS4 TaxID=2807195 RepID=UPI001B03FDC7|nr:HAMP domain-containing sensor histidine kinase [Paenibacillus sp. J31TS4]GIP40131.1 two-component sensor histidine kinase [Paenibacillus sp. J31TS4]